MSTCLLLYSVVDLSLRYFCLLRPLLTTRDDIRPTSPCRGDFTTVHRFQYLTPILGACVTRSHKVCLNVHVSGTPFTHDPERPCCPPVTDCFSLIPSSPEHPVRVLTPKNETRSTLGTFPNLVSSLHLTKSSNSPCARMLDPLSVSSCSHLRPSSGFSDGVGVLDD